MDGVTLGRYRLLSRIATGGMGEVHRGVDVGWGGVERPVAVKLIAPEFARHPDFVTTFVDEAKLSYQLCHPNIVQVRDIGRVGEAADGTYFIAMEWVDGADLGTIISKLREGPKQPLPLRFCVLVALDAARGLDYAHRLRDAQGNLFHLVHRDVSPTNLLVSYEGDVKVTDFGIARWRAREAISLPGSLKGKIGYMAPEQARGEEVDARADVFALGVVLYELVTGQNPFTHGAREVEVLERVRHGRFAPPSTIVALPQGLEAIILRAMAPARAQRYASCAALREDLEGFARRESFLLSPAAFGQFVRALVQGELAGARDPALADTERHAELKKAPTPRPFDLALGAQLAALTSDDQPAPEEPARGGVTVPGKRVETAPARTVALHAVIAPPPERETPSPSSPSSPSSSGEAHVGSRSPSTSEIAEMVPRNNRRPLIAGALVVLVGAVVAVTAMMMRRSPEAPVAQAAPPTANAAPPGAPTDAPIDPPAATPLPANVAKLEGAPRPLVSAAAPPHAHHAPAPVAQPARLSVSSDVEAHVFVDGQFVRAAPVRDLAVAAGTHTVRVEGSAQGLHLLPKEETVTLRDGESRSISLELR